MGRKEGGGEPKMEKKRSTSKHILLLPFMAQGHLKPFLELAHQIQRRSSGMAISLLTTPLNVRLLRTMSGPAADSPGSSSIRLVELPFRCSDHGLPDQAENTQVLPLTAVIKLFHASTALETPVRDFISREILAKDGAPPLCIISDVFLGWAVHVAKSFGSLAFTFSTGGAYGTAAYISLWKDLPHQHCNDEEDFCLSGFPETHRFRRSQLHRFLRAADGTDDWSRFFQPQIGMSMTSAGWLCNGIEEMEPLGMSILRNYLKLPVWAVGTTIPISLSPVSISPSKEAAGARPDEGIIGWLHLQAEDSVLYISFGSQNTITPLQMMELAAGLEDSGRPFIWVIRPPFGFDVEGEFRSEWLPDGFEERVVETQKRGLLVHKWAPQRKVLSHKCTGAFLSHCGWNSVMESLSHGVPMIGWPLAAEQAYNSKMLEEDTGVAVELTRGLEGALTKERVKEVVDMVLDRRGRGGEMKRKATEVSEKIRLATTEEGVRKGSSVMAMDDFLHKVLHDTV